MTPEQATGLIIAVTGLVGAITAVFVQLRQTHQLINSRMTELVETTKLAAQKSGELAGRDWRAGAMGTAGSPPEPSAAPSP